MDKLARRDFIKITGAMGAGLAAFPALAKAIETGGSSSLPNFVVYISDDHSMLYSEPYGHLDIHTPNLTRLASEGVRFTHMFNASPSCGPSRTAMLTALWPARNGAEPNHMAPHSGVEGLPSILKSLGYETAAIGKVAHNDWAKLYHFDYIAGPNAGAINTDELALFLNARDSSKPLCLFFGTHFPHTPWLKNEVYDPAKIQPVPTFVNTTEMREQLAKYYTSVSKTDEILGQVRSLLQQHVPGNTLFIYTADHGAALPFSKWDLYDAGTRLPFIAVWPGHLQPGTVNDATLCLPDLLPTFIELAGGKVPEGLDGKSFAGILRGTASTHRDRTFATQSGDGDYNVYPSRSLRTHDWKYILNLHPEFQHHSYITRSPSPGTGILFWNSWLEAAKTDADAAAKVKRYIIRPAEELYDLQNDPFEMNNLAADPAQAERLASMGAELKAWMKEQGDQEKVFGKPLLIGQPVTMIQRVGGE